jgi:hypothetical protein
MTRYLGDIGVEAKPVRDHDAAFARHLAARTRCLFDRSFVARHARAMIFALMFDAWQDPRVAREFVRSFFEDFARRATGPQRPRIVRCLVDGLGGDGAWQTAEDLEAAFEIRLQEAAWEDDEWL